MLAQGTRSLGIIISMILLQGLYHQFIEWTYKNDYDWFKCRYNNVSVITIKQLDSKADTW